MADISFMEDIFDCGHLLGTAICIDGQVAQAILQRSDERHLTMEQMRPEHRKSLLDWLEAQPIQGHS